MTTSTITLPAAARNLAASLRYERGQARQKRLRERRRAELRARLVDAETVESGRECLREAAAQEATP